MKKVFLNNINISKNITQIPTIKSGSGDYGQLTSTDLPNLTGDNRLGFFDVNNPSSPFFGAVELSKYDIEIQDNGVIVYVGTIQQLQSNNQSKQANIVLKSNIQRQLEKGLIYASSQESTPSTIVQEICDLYEIPIDTSSFSRSNSEYTDNSVVCTAFYKGEGTIQEAFQQIAEIGIARIYIYNNKLYYDVFRTRSASPVVYFSDQVNLGVDRRLYSHANTTNIEKEKIEGYKIQWIGTPDATFGSESQQGKTISGDYNSNMRIMSFQSAIWIGEQWLKYFSNPQNHIVFDVSNEIGRSLTINNAVGLKYKSFETILDIKSIDNSSIVKSTIEGITR